MRSYTMASESFEARLLGTADRGCPVGAETVYNLLFGTNPGWLVLPVAGDGTLVVIAPDGTPLEIARS